MNTSEQDRVMRAGRAVAAAAALWIAAPGALEAQVTYYACGSQRLYQDTINLEHRGWGVDARGNWDGGHADILAGAWRGFENGMIHPNQTSVALYRNAAPGMAQDCMLPSDRIGGVGTDRFGYAVAWIGDLDGDGFHDFMAGAPRGGSGTERGRVYLFLSADFAAGLPADAEDASLIIEDTVDGARFGFSIARADHFIPEDPEPSLDVVVGAPGGNAAFPQPGAAYVFSGADLMLARTTYGKSALTLRTDPLYTHTYPVNGLLNGDLLGSSVALAGDVNLDQAGDIVIGAPQSNWAGAAGNGRPGYALVILGGSTHPQTLLVGEHNGSAFGHCVGGEADVDGNGDEVLIGAPFYDKPVAGGVEDKVGKVYVWSHGSAAYLRDHVGTLVVVLHKWEGEQRGWGLTGLGDLNGDGRDEYTVGSWRYGEATAPGACAPAPLPCGGLDTSAAGQICGRCVVMDGATGNALFQILGEDGKDSCGTWASPIRDMNGNGKPDLVVSAFRWSPVLNPDPGNQAEVGRVYLHVIP